MTMKLSTISRKFMAAYGVGAVVLSTFVLLFPLTAVAQTIPATTQQIDSLAGKSDRWLFVASLVLLLGFGAMVVKWLLAQLDRQREANAQSTKELVEHLKSNASEFATALKANTVALENNNRTNQEIIRLLNDDHRVLALLRAAEQNQPNLG